MNKRIFSILLATFLIFSINNVIAQEEDKDTNVKLNQIAPNFSATTIDGQKIELSKLKGKVVLVNFFATWCGPCMTEMPYLEKDIWKKHKSDNFVLISLGREHNMDEIVEFNKEKNFSFLLAPDPGRKIYSLYADKYIPRNYLINKKGEIIYQSKGFNEDEFKELKDLIEEKVNK